jgi:hypothetical protein
MNDFIQQQIDASERLYNMMLADHKERTKQMAIWADTSASLIKKLDERDAEIKLLKSQIVALKAASSL